MEFNNKRHDRNVTFVPLYQTKSGKLFPDVFSFLDIILREYKGNDEPCTIEYSFNLAMHIKTTLEMFMRKNNLIIKERESVLYFQDKSICGDEE